MTYEELQPKIFEIIVITCVCMMVMVDLLLIQLIKLDLYQDLGTFNITKIENVFSMYYCTTNFCLYVAHT